jgi:hypothetical protein
MRAHFSEYYRPTPSQFKKLWADAIFSFDANVLLDLYRFSQDSRNELLELMKAQRARIWVSNQAALEFYRNRLEAIEGVHKSTKEILAQLSRATQILDDECKQHPYLSAKIIREIRTKLNQCTESIGSAQASHPDLSKNDEIADSIASVLEGRIGDPYPPEKLDELSKIIQARYDRKIPPGYEDAKKKPFEMARGDALVWFQLMDKAKAEQKPMIFVTDDAKEDWWLRHKGQTLMPRPELRREFFETTGQEFFAYSTLSFVEHAKKAVHTRLGDTLIAEAREISKRRENSERMKNALKWTGIQPSSGAFYLDYSGPKASPGIQKILDLYVKENDLESEETSLRNRLGDPGVGPEERDRLLSQIHLLHAARLSAKFLQNQLLSEKLKVRDSIVDTDSPSSLEE